MGNQRTKKERHKSRRNHIGHANKIEPIGRWKFSLILFDSIWFRFKSKPKPRISIPVLKTHHSRKNRRPNQQQPRRWIKKKEKQKTTEDRLECRRESSSFFFCRRERERERKTITLENKIPRAGPRKGQRERERNKRKTDTRKKEMKKREGKWQTLDFPRIFGCVPRCHIGAAQRGEQEPERAQNPKKQKQKKAAP